jgi:uncharacterized protein YecE (DUF72 family)
VVKPEPQKAHLSAAEEPPRVLVGVSGFSYRPWLGRFYPKGLPAKDMLPYYATRLPAVEINNSFYRMPDETVLAGWAGQTPDHFRFAIKAPGSITHTRRLKHTEDAVRRFIDGVEGFGPKLTAVLFGLPPAMKKDTPLLREFLGVLPPGPRYAFEFRHPSWFADEVFTALRDHGAALCIAESEEGPNAPRAATADWGYLRLRRLDYTDADLHDWADWILGQDWPHACVFFKHEDLALGPQFAESFLRILGRHAPGEPSGL